MKKILLAFIVFTAAVILTAETGYRGVEWGMTSRQVREKKNATTGTSSIYGGYDEFLVEKDLILKEFTEVYYYFFLWETYSYLLCNRHRQRRYPV